MPLNDAEILGSKPKAKPFRWADAKGLFVEILPSGSKLWRFKYRFTAKEKTLALGAYPENWQMRANDSFVWIAEE
ncbi:hypothetical protein HME9302_02090 [Alteripontixanthobacter maritimus]|uniref:Integrase DNA-binding domain-containing protein n=1 Tax=Alteripontixanthobacter maritimus TaxID=2161824 RepID=A0A369Q844_9SPHN|nr:Arm DNA-binding domain-containing protein [Alteripontixanthobacter maritimus]RDC60874.1 hypothetical protein HME9302_02090 [Alteripontixanthobacter maritimus]